jgi:hypothetical protein
LTEYPLAPEVAGIKPMTVALAEIGMKEVAEQFRARASYALPH